MLPNKETQLFTSISRYPGNSGATFHNSAYQALGINALYLPRKLDRVDQLASLVDSLRILEISGCSVSMPFKEEIIPYLDDLDESARLIGAVNTVKQENGALVGYNTDYFGAYEALKLNDVTNKNVFILGAGGVAKAIAFAARKLQNSIIIINRTQEKASALAASLNGRALPFNALYDICDGYFINATSIGMNAPDDTPLGQNTLKQLEGVMDAVLYPCPTKLVNLARDLGKVAISGAVMNVHQADKQFAIYTGRNLDSAFLTKRQQELEKC